MIRGDAIDTQVKRQRIQRTSFLGHMWHTTQERTLKRIDIILMSGIT